jgi:hypothetical protein
MVSFKVIIGIVFNLIIFEIIRANKTVLFKLILQGTKINKISALLLFSFIFVATLTAQTPQH